MKSSRVRIIITDLKGTSVIGKRAMQIFRHVTNSSSINKRPFEENKLLLNKHGYKFQLYRVPRNVNLLRTKYGKALEHLGLFKFKAPNPMNLDLKKIPVQQVIPEPRAHYFMKVAYGLGAAAPKQVIDLLYREPEPYNNANGNQAQVPVQQKLLRNLLQVEDELDLDNDF